MGGWGEMNEHREYSGDGTWHCCWRSAALCRCRRSAIGILRGEEWPVVMEGKGSFGDGVPTCPGAPSFARGGGREAKSAGEEYKPELPRWGFRKKKMGLCGQNMGGRDREGKGGIGWGWPRVGARGGAGSEEESRGGEGVVVLKAKGAFPCLYRGRRVRRAALPEARGK